MSIQPSSASGPGRSRFSLRFSGQILLLLVPLFIVPCAGSTLSSNAPAATPTFISTAGNDLVTTIDQSPVAGAVTVHVTELEFAIISSITTFHPNVPYYFIISNTGKQTHAFTFVPTYPNGTPMDEYYQYAHMLIVLNTIPPGTTQTINYTFKATDTGHYEIACRMRNHYMAGMHIPVLVV